MPRPIATLLLDTTTLQTGDILIFRSDPLIDPTFDQKAIAFFQSLTSDKEGGHSYSTHAGICIGLNDKQEAMIAHVTDTSNPDLIEYIKEPLNIYMQRENSIRPFLIYRSTTIETAKRIGEMAASAQDALDQHITWEYSSAAAAIVNELRAQPSSLLELNLEKNKDAERKAFSLSTHCSKFVAEVIDHATHGKWNEHLRVDSTCSVKNLEHALHKDEEHYQLLYYPGAHCPYDVLKAEILKQLNCIKQKNNAASLQKFEACQKVFTRTTAYLEPKHDMNALQKADYLMLQLDGLLAINTGYNLKKSGSHEKIVDLAKRFCLFHHDEHEHINTRDIAHMSIPVSESTYKLHAEEQKEAATASSSCCPK